MPGPLPKPKGQRRRRNTVAGAHILPREGYQGPLPELPLRQVAVDGVLLERAWPDVVVKWWARVWRSPMAVVWAENETDFFALVRLAGLMHGALLGDPRAAAEARQLEDRLGLSPMARRRLVWEIAGGDADTPTNAGGAPAAADDEPATAPERAPAPEAPAVDPRHLRAIAGGR